MLLALLGLGLALAALPPLDDLRAPVSTDYAAAASRKRREAIASLKGVPMDRGSEERRAELMTRLADLYADEGRYTGDPAWLGKAVELERAVLRSYPRYARAHEVTFDLAVALALLGEHEEAARQLTTLIRTWPESHHIPEAYARLGDHYAAQGRDAEPNVFKALLAYQKAARYRDDPVATYSLYRLAWCLAVVGEPVRAEAQLAELEALLGEDPSAHGSAVVAGWVAEDRAAGFPHELSRWDAGPNTPPPDVPTREDPDEEPLIKPQKPLLPTTE